MTGPDLDAPRWWRPYGTTGDIEVLYVDLSVDETLDREADAWLDQAEKNRWERFRVERARREFARCRAALRACLCERLECRNDQLDFGASRHGKPYARVDGKGRDAAFNVSHSHGHGLIAFAPDGMRIGVDLETPRIRKRLQLVSESVFTGGELDALAAASGGDWHALFFRIWSIKEALIKALGTGFTLNPQRFEIPANLLHGASSAHFRFPHLPDDRWLVTDLGEPRFAAALAVAIDDGEDRGSRSEFQRQDG